MIHSMTVIRRRARRRLIREHLPDDLQGDPGYDLINGGTRIIMTRDADAHHNRHRGKPAFDQPARFHHPSMPDQVRQVSADGRRTVHLRVEREHQVSAAAADKYAAGKPTEMALEPDAIALAPHDHGRGASIADTYVTSHGGEDDADPLSFTNLLRDPRLRPAQWDEIEAVEASHGLTRKGKRQRGSDRINICPSRCPDLITAVVADPDCPETFRSAIIREKERQAGGEKLNARRERVGAPYLEAAKATHAWVRTTHAWRIATDKERTALKFSCGRDQPTYATMDIELPAEFDNLAVTNVVGGIVQFIAKQSAHPDHEIAGAQVPVSAAVHRPGRLNDDRNLHFHLTRGERRLLINPDGSLARDDHGHLICEAVKPPMMTSMGQIARLRSHFADLANIELQRLQVSYRLDPRTDEELGNGGLRMKKVGAEATVLARAGVASPLRLENAIEGWRRKHRENDANRKRSMERERRRARAVARKLQLMKARGHDVGGQHAIAEKLHARHISAIEARHERTAIELIVKMAKSAPEEVARYAPGYADDARQKGNRTYDGSGWIRRGEEALAYLSRLDDHLALERDAIEARRLIEMEALAAVERLTEKLIADMAVPRTDRGREAPALIIDSVNDNVPLSPAEVSRVSEPATSAATEEIRRIGPHAAARFIRNTPLRISEEHGRLFVDRRDDPACLVIDADLEEIQFRLQMMKKRQDRELAQIDAYVRKYGEFDFREERVAKLTGNMPEVIARWRHTPVFNRIRAEHRRKAATAAITSREVLHQQEENPFLGGLRTTAVAHCTLAPLKDRKLPTSIDDRPLDPAAAAQHGVVKPAPSKSAVIPPSPTVQSVATKAAGPATLPAKPSRSQVTIISERDLGPALTRQAESASRRAGATMKKLLAGKMWQSGKPTAIVRQFLIDLHAKPEYYRLDQDGALVCRQSGDRTLAFELMMRDTTVAGYARRYYEAGRRSEPLPNLRWLGVNERLPAHHHDSGGWIRTAQREQQRLSARLPDLIVQRPRLTVGPDHLIGIRDEGLVTAAGADALGLYDRRIQMRLRAAWLIQREEEHDALAMIAAGEVEFALRRVKRSKTLKLAPKDSAPALPPLFDPFIHDPAFITKALGARKTGSPAQVFRFALLRAWDAASREHDSVQRVLAEIVLADPKTAGHLGSAERAALLQSAGTAQTAGRGIRRRRGLQHTSRTR